MVRRVQRRDDLVLLGVRQPRIERQREGQAVGEIGVGEVPGPQPVLLGVVGLQERGVRALARGDALLLINADATVTPGCLDALLQRLAADSRAAIVGPRLVYGDGSFQRWTAGRLPSLGAAASY